MNYDINPAHFNPAIIDEDIDGVDACIQDGRLAAAYDLLAELCRAKAIMTTAQRKALARLGRTLEKALDNE